MRELLSGAIVMGYIVAALHFVKFFRQTRDKLFGMFAAAFCILAVQRLLLAVFADAREAHVFLYGIRVLAFLLIIFAIIAKNREAAD